MYRQLLIGALLGIFEQKPPPHEHASARERKRLENLSPDLLREEYQRKTGGDPEAVKPDAKPWGIGPRAPR